VHAAAEGAAPVRRALLLAAALLALGAAPAGAQFDPAYEASNFSKTNERAAIHSTPEYKALLARVSAANTTPRATARRSAAACGSRGRGRRSAPAS